MSSKLQVLLEQLAASGTGVNKVEFIGRLLTPNLRVPPYGAFTEEPTEDNIVERLSRAGVAEGTIEKVRIFCRGEDIPASRLSGQSINPADSMSVEQAQHEILRLQSELNIANSKYTAAKQELEQKKSQVELYKTQAGRAEGLQQQLIMLQQQLEKRDDDGSPPSPSALDVPVDNAGLEPVNTGPGPDGGPPPPSA